MTTAVVRDNIQSTDVSQGLYAATAFEKPCTECGGYGIVYNPAWAEWSRAFDEADEARREELLNLMPSSPEEIPCPECNGQGTVPTDLGLALLRFLRRYL